ncbi:hypothetical protein JOE30_003755 [Rhodococcus sp. PvP016]|nr:hypothetical protein [Rhodococcus sp. PvP016]
MLSGSCSRFWQERGGSTSTAASSPFAEEYIREGSAL